MITCNQAFISQIYRAVSPLEVKFKFFSPLGFEAKSDFHHVGASERYLNDMNPIHSRQTVSIFQFSAEFFNQTRVDQTLAGKSAYRCKVFSKTCRHTRTYLGPYLWTVRFWVCSTYPVTQDNLSHLFRLGQGLGQARYRF